MASATARFLSILDEVSHDLSFYHHCQSTRDTFLYAASVDSRGLEPTVEILGEFDSESIKHSFISSTIIQMVQATLF